MARDEDDRYVVDLDDPHGGSAAPEAITEHPGLGFERRAEARWLVDVFGMRMLAVALARRAHKRRGEFVPPIPWMVIVGTFAIVAAAILAGWALVTVFG